jgi:hypothetical protein
MTVTYEYELSVDKGTVRLDRRRKHRPDRDRYDVEGTIPLSVLDCFDPETDGVMVAFAGLEQGFPPGSFVRHDDKWRFKAPRRAKGTQRIDLRDNGRFKIQARRVDFKTTTADFPRLVDFSISIGPTSGDTQIQLDRRLRLRRGKRRGRR